MEEKSKNCPLSYAMGKGAYDQEIATFDLCREGECAWWDDFTGLCAIAVIARFGAEGTFYMARKEQKADRKEE